MSPLPEASQYESSMTQYHYYDGNSKWLNGARLKRQELSLSILAEVFWRAARGVERDNVVRAGGLDQGEAVAADVQDGFSDAQDGLSDVQDVHADEQTVHGLPDLSKSSVLILPRLNSAHQSFTVE